MGVVAHAEFYDTHVLLSVKIVFRRKHNTRLLFHTMRMYYMHFNSELAQNSKVSIENSPRVLLRRTNISVNRFLR